MSVTVCGKNKCTGCNACINICPKKCIYLVDNVKSLDVVIDKNLCINCKLCEKVCQVVNTENELIKFQTPIGVYEGATKIDDINKESSSGGFATTLGYEFAKSGGYVVGIKSDKESFYFDITNNPEEVKLFAGSKYVKVSTRDIYKSIKTKLVENEKVLFFGVPCQVAGLKLYLQKEYPNLYTVDLICHGTPSEKVLLKYLNERGVENTKNLRFRFKHDFKLSTTDENNKKLIAFCDSYTMGFLDGIFYTENCYECKYARKDRISDITIGDSWGSKIVGKDGHYYLSLVIINNEKGEYLKSLLVNNFDFYERDYEEAIARNGQLSHPSVKTHKTDYYFEHFNDMTTYKIMKKKCHKMVLRKRLKWVLVKLHLKK